MRLALLFLASTAMAFAQAVPGGSTSSTSGGALTGCESPASATISGGGLSIPTGGGCVAVDTEGAAATDDVTAVVCPAGTSFTLVAANDARTVVLKSASFAVFGAVDQSLDQDGDYALGFCPTENTPIIWGFYDEAGSVRAAALEAAGSGTTYFTEQAAPGAAATAGDHNFYFDSSNGRLYNHKNGGSALPISYTLTHADDCTAVTVVGTGVSLLAGDQCHELDADTNYVYDGAAWDLVGGGGGSTRFSLLKKSFGFSNAAGGFQSTEGAVGCQFDAAITTNSGTDLILHGAPFMNATSNEGFECRGPVIPTGVDLTNLAFSVAGSEFVDNTNNWDVELQVACPTNGEVLPAFAEVGAITISATAGATGEIATGTDTTVDISGSCAAGDVLFARVQIGTASTSTDDLVILAVDVYEQ